MKHLTAPNRPKINDQKWGCIAMNTTPFLIVNFRRFRVGEMVHFILIPFQKNKDTFQLRESSRELPIVKWLVFVIQATLRSVIPEALTRSNVSLFFWNGIRQFLTHVCGD